MQRGEPTLALEAYLQAALVPVLLASVTQQVANAHHDRKGAERMIRKAQDIDPHHEKVRAKFNTSADQLPGVLRDRQNSATCSRVCQSSSGMRTIICVEVAL